MEHNVGCEQAAGGCDDRWLCAGFANWLTRVGLSPWGEPSDERDLLRYLAGMTPDEHSTLVTIAFDNLDSGYWEGFPSPNGGYEHGPPDHSREVSWHAAARDFMKRVAEGDRRLTEGMIAHAMWDLARELAWVPGWCPRGKPR